MPILWLAGDFAHCVVKVSTSPKPGDVIDLGEMDIIAEDCYWARQMGQRVQLTCIVGMVAFEGERIALCGARSLQA